MEGSIKPADDMISTAKRQSTYWKQTSINDRITYLKKLQNVLINQLDHYVAWISKRTNKHQLDVLTGDFLIVFSALDYYIKNGTEILNPVKKKSPFPFWGCTSYVRYEPYGVVLIFSPWNYPFQLSILPIISAFITGNTIILKCSDQLPGFAPFLRSIFDQLNLPDGILQIIDGNAMVGQTLIEAKPNLVFFTGSHTTGDKVYQKAASLGIPCILELSGKDPMVVFDDCHLDRAANAAVWGSLVNGGQACVSVERIYVQSGIYGSFVEKVKDILKKIDSKSFSGMTTKESMEHVKKQVMDAINRGASHFRPDFHDEPFPIFLPPTLLTNVSHEMEIMRDETFGPVIAVMPFETEDDAIRLVNDSPYGLNAYLFTRNKSRIRRMIPLIESGSIFINDVVTNISNIHLPFGGVKCSGIGHYHGREGLLNFCSPKSVMQNNKNSGRNVNWYPYNKKAYSYIRNWIKWRYKAK
ncbi:aldehyde dehydrogenase family protein [Falsibacillus albus]|uniref:Aldehyde dehydrogenase n=1 Tax=Falsibacillus albus TaxID=2478915 RepID=A0A3L7JXH6_9BACI|nr:aldehyde dehydrogenase family protein [Falsibacillus albus]RLQ95497.1 aldehyde dehydrogenase family protein [Falsibacillus albus]